MKLIDIIRNKIPEGTFWTHSKTIIDGCTPISPGCKNCWLAGMYRRNLPGFLFSALNVYGQFNGQTFERPGRLEGIIPKRPRKPRVWTYWSDVFHPGVSNAFRDSLLNRCSLSSQDYHIIITKRPEVAVCYCKSLQLLPPLPNVLILVTMEDQARADLRAPHALRLAAMGWKVGVLCEPLLGPIDLTRIPAVGAARHVDNTNCLTGATTSEYSCRAHCNTTTAGLSWLITGGESGHNARPAHPDWFRSLRDQAKVAGVPFLLKHVSKQDGRSLDGRTWDEVPDL